MKKIFSLFILSLLILSCGNTDNEKSSLEELNEQKLVIITKIDSLNNELKKVEKNIAKLDTTHRLQIVTALPVKFDTFKHYIEIQGVVKADKNIEIKPELGGTVNAIYVKEGQRVSAGQVLAQLDDASIKNNVAELKTQLSLAKTTFERQERLWNQKIGSEMQYLQAKTQMESLESNLAVLNTQARKMKIIAPFSGIVDEIFPKKGELTSPQTPVVRLINLDKVHVEAEVTEFYLPIVKVGTETILNFPSINKQVTSKITQVSNFINPDNRSFKIRIDIPNKDQLIKPNLLADLKILDFDGQGIIIPSTIIQQDQNGNNYVFTIETTNDEHKVVKKSITIGNEYNHEAFVSEGLTHKDTLVNAGARLVKKDDLVDIRLN